MQNEHSHKLNGDTPLRPAVTKFLSKFAENHAYKLIKFQGTLMFNGGEKLTREEMVMTCEFAVDRIIARHKLDRAYRDEMMRMHRQEAWLVNVFA